MDCLLILYLFLLFVLLTPNTIFKLPIKNKLLLVILHGLLFVLIFQITYSIIQRNIIENLEVQGTNTESLVNIIKMISERLNQPEDNKNYVINNELIQVTPSVANEYDMIDEENVENVVIAPPFKVYK